MAILGIADQLADDRRTSADGGHTPRALCLPN